MVVFKRRKTEPPANGHDAAHAVRSRARRMGSNPTVCEQARRPGFLFDPQTDGATDMDPNTLKTIYEAQLEAQLMEDLTPPVHKHVDCRATRCMYSPSARD